MSGMLQNKMDNITAYIPHHTFHQPHRQGLTHDSTNQTPISLRLRPWQTALRAGHQERQGTALPPTAWQATQQPRTQVKPRPHQPHPQHHQATCEVHTDWRSVRVHPCLLTCAQPHTRQPLRSPQGQTLIGEEAHIQIHHGKPTGYIPASTQS